MTELIINIIYALIFILALIFLLFYFYKKRPKNTNLIDVLAYQQVGQKMAITAIKIRDEIIYLGISQNDFKLIKRVSIKENDSKFDIISDLNSGDK